MKLQDLINYYELKARSIENLMPEYARWGSDKYYQHRLSMIREFLKGLNRLVEPEDPTWHDADDPPETSDYVLLHFCNMKLPMIGRYEGNERDGGNYYIGDDTEPALKGGLIVDAWTLIPGYDGS